MKRSDRRRTASRGSTSSAPPGRPVRPSATGPRGRSGRPAGADRSSDRRTRSGRRSDPRSRQKPFGIRHARTPEQIDRLIAAQPWSVLDEPLLALGADAALAMGQLQAFARMVIEWNGSASNVLSRNDEPRIVDRHFLESLASAEWLRESGCTRWIDLGSGAGFPALPLAIAGVGRTWTLVESRRTKTLFLRKAIETLRIDRVQVENARLEDLVLEGRLAGAFDGFTSRATMRLGPTLTLAASLVTPGGSAFLWKGSGRDQEMDADVSWRDLWEHAGTRAVKNGPVAVARFIRRKTD